MKTIEDQKIKQPEAFKALKPEENQELEWIEVLFPKNIKNLEIKNNKWYWKKKKKSKWLNIEIG